jgi:hypothetical protein
MISASPNHLTTHALMATLALAVAGAAVGNALLPAGITILGATLTGAAVGAQVGALGGSFIDNALFGASGRSRALGGPRLTELHVTGASEGAPIPRLYGRARVGGQLIWATDFEEDVATTSQTGGGKGGALGPQSRSVEYHYFASFAEALCEGEIAGIAESGPMAPSSISPPSHTASIPAARRKPPTA